MCCAMRPPGAIPVPGSGIQVAAAQIAEKLKGAFCNTDLQQEDSHRDPETLDADPVSRASDL